MSCVATDITKRNHSLQGRLLALFKRTICDKKKTVPAFKSEQYERNCEISQFLVVLLTVFSSRFNLRPIFHLNSEQYEKRTIRE